MLPAFPPHASVPELVDNDRRDLLTAIRLLSGYECLRDPSQAQVLLVGLTESRHPEVAEEARSILKTGLTRDWFGTVTPRHSELERMAGRTIAAHRSKPPALARPAMGAAIGMLVAMAVGLMLFLQGEGGTPALSGIPWVMVMVLFLLVALGIIFALRLRNR